MRIKALSAMFACGVAAAASAQTVMVQSTDSPWNYNTTYGAETAGYLSTTPTITSFTPGSGQTLTFSSVTGSVSLTPGYAYGPDGGNSSPPGANPLSVSAANGLSGIISGHAAFLAGVFLNGQEAAPGHQPPATLSFSSYSFASLAPLDDQVFFIGDGMTGTGTGAQQTFAVPADATSLVLGIADAYGYSGAPGAYYDNTGSFSATFAITQAPSMTAAAPEPSTWALMIVGVGAVGIAMRRRRSVPHRLFGSSSWPSSGAQVWPGFVATYRRNRSRSS